MWIATERKHPQRWIVPGFVTAAGLAVALTIAVRGHPDTALVVLAVLVGYGALLAFRRGELVSPLHDAYGTGRAASNHVRAAAMTGDVLVGVIVGAVLVQALRGGEVGVFAGLAAVAGVTYLLSMVALSRSL